MKLETLKNRAALLINLSYVFMAALFFGCIEPPVPNDERHNTIGPSSALVLCEGLWHMDNSSLTRFDLNSHDIIADYFQYSNPELKLGDLANHFILQGDTAFIVVTTAKTIEIINARTGKWLGRIVFEGKRAPRRIALASDSTAWVSDLYSHSISEIDTRNFKILRNVVPCGPAPEGIFCYDNFVYVANSGYGDYLADEPKAGAISIIETTSGTEIGSITNLPDVVELIGNTDKLRLYAVYYNLPKYPDSLGGIVEIDLLNRREIRRWRIDASAAALTPSGDTLMFFTNAGLEMLDLRFENPQPQLLIAKTNPNDYWYSLSIATDGSIWLGNAKNYCIAGEVIVFSKDDLLNPKYRFDTGINPNTILFLE